MTITIPSSVYDIYNEICDFLIDDNNIGKNCTLIYPPIRSSCDNCIINSIGGGSINVYRHGGPAPFNFGSCPLCGGNGYKEIETTGSIRLRIYWKRKDWIRIAGSANISNADVQVIGYFKDLQNLLRANEIVLVSEQSLIDMRMSLAGEPSPHGFGKNRYFIAYLRKV